MDTIPKLIAKAVLKFHAFIRKRDQGKPCISCGRYTRLQAGHFYSAGKHPGLRFDPDNVNGQCKQCNWYLSGNLTEYEKNLRERIGNERVKALHLKAAQYKRLGFKWNRFYLLEVIDKYK